MAKAKAEMTPKQKAYSDAKIKYDAAVAADETKSTAATQQAVANAGKVRDETYAAVKRENFVRVAKARVIKVRIGLRNLGGINNLRTYTYSAADVDAAEKGIKEAADAAIASMRNGLNTKAAAPAAGDTFSFPDA